MKENLVSLAKLLATDDAFNLAFSSRGTDEEKYELAKTKFTDLTREDFSEFLEKLHEAEKANLAELSPDELEMVAGGAGGWATKLAAAAMFVTALGATGVMSQQADASPEHLFDASKVSLFHNVNAQVHEADQGAFVSDLDGLSTLLNDPSFNDNNYKNATRRLATLGTKLGNFAKSIFTAAKNPQKTTTNKGEAFTVAKDFLNWCIDELRGGRPLPLPSELTPFAEVRNAANIQLDKALRDSELADYIDSPGTSVLNTFNVTLNSETAPREIKLTKQRFQHIFVGDIDEQSNSFNYGHTKYAKAFADAVATIRNNNLRSTQFRDLYKLLVGTDSSSSTSTSVQCNGNATAYTYVSTTSNGIFKGTFPENWTWENIKAAATACLTHGQMLNPQGNGRYLTYVLGSDDSNNSFGFPIRAAIDPTSNELITCFPDLQMH